MVKSIVFAAIILGTVACGNENNSMIENDAKTSTQCVVTMKNSVSIVEIPVSDFTRAVTFYQSILGISIEKVDMAGTEMGVLPSNNNSVSVVLVKGNDYKPGTEGAVVYLNAGDDLQIMLDLIVKSGGKLVVPKTEISPEMGFFALFIDTEGNKLGLHSKK